MKDGMSGPSDWFETSLTTEDKKVNPSESLKEKIKAAKKDKEKEKELAPAPCPDNPENTYTKEHCDTCKSREGCPSWK
jgi:hypothetical protein